MKKVLIVTSNYYKNISSKMLKNSIELIIKNNLKYRIINVPGVFEIPVTISKNIRNFDAFIALGCVIKGETPHFDFISNATTLAIMNLSVDRKKSKDWLVKGDFNENL